MNVLSLFDGISCGQLALTRAGKQIDNYFASEIEAYPIQITQKHFPKTVQLGDVRNINTSTLPKIDLLIGGSPCQSFSNAGNRIGFAGKSGLFYEYVRILKEVKPTYFLLENVKMKNEWRDEISKCLGVQPIEICSSHFSAQKRKRYYWTNIPVPNLLPNHNILLKDIIDVKEYREPVFNHRCIVGKDNIGNKYRNGNAQGYLYANDFDAVDLNYPGSVSRRSRVQTQRANTVTTKCTFGIQLNGELYKMNIHDYEKLQTLPIDYTAGIPKTHREKAVGNGWTVDVIAHILSFIP